MFHKLFIFLLFILSLSLFAIQAFSQPGVAPTYITTTITVRDNGSAAHIIEMRQPLVTVTSTGQELRMPRCTADVSSQMRPKIAEWNIKVTGRIVGKDCVSTYSFTAKDLKMLDEQVRLATDGGSVIRQKDKFTLKLVRNMKPLVQSTPLLRYTVTFNYILTVPALETFSAGKKLANQVTWSSSNLSHSIEIKGKLSKGKTDCLVSPEELQSILPHLSGAKAQEILDLLNEAMQRAGALTRAQQWAFISQAAVETGGFRSFVERGSGNYFSRYDPGTRVAVKLGNTEVGDGAKFKGRGWTHLTGRDNYTRLTRYLRNRGRNVDLVLNPDMVATEPDIMAEAAAWDWKVNKKMNARADRENIEDITRGINGGLTALEERSKFYEAAKIALPKSEICP